MDHQQQQQPQENSTTPEVLIDDCHQDSQQPTTNGECPLPRPRLLVNRSDSTASGGKTKRKTRSTRRRLNAMVNNASLHFSDTDSEGELTVARVSTPNHTAGDQNLLQPTISVTLEASDGGDSSCGERRNSYLENLTDVDEIYASEPEGNGIRIIRRSLAVVEPAHHQGDTEFEDMSNDEEEVVEPAVFVKPRSDILTDFNGETITTREGDGPFSVEIRNQMSLDDATVNKAPTPDIAVVPTTDSEEMETSDEEAEAEGASGPRDAYEDFDVVAASQIVMKNVSKMEQQLLTVREPDELDAISDSHTDVEDFE